MTWSFSSTSNVVGIGIDTVEILRFGLVLKRRPNLIRKLFSPQEIKYATKFKDPTQRFAVRFSAKEATMKALGVGIGSFGFDEVEVISKNKAPYIELRGRALELANSKDIGKCLVSLTHTSVSATAIVVALQI